MRNEIEAVLIKNIEAMLISISSMILMWDNDCIPVNKNKKARYRFPPSDFRPLVNKRYDPMKHKKRMNVYMLVVH